MSENNTIFTVGLKAFIEYEGKLLVLWSSEYGIDFPGGRIKDGEENVEESLKREVKEETGLLVEVGEPLISWIFTQPSGHKIFSVGYKCTSSSNKVLLSEEHEKYYWVDKKSYKRLLKKVLFDIDTVVLRKYFNE